mmetsp:Transcript_39056/g.48388  ORF Transcript_39056/g.48388 Transcript_39056/m.48388 type:complete len:130 (+) Transcript_39056:346-735(+)
MTTPGAPWTLGRCDFGDGSACTVGAAPKTSGGRDLEWRFIRPFREVVAMLGTLKMLKDRCAVIFSVVVRDWTPLMSKELAISLSLCVLSKRGFTPGTIHGGTTEGVNGQTFLVLSGIVGFECFSARALG